MLKLPVRPLIRSHLNPLYTHKLLMLIIIAYSYTLLYTLEFKLCFENAISQETLLAQTTILIKIVNSVPYRVVRP